MFTSLQWPPFSVLKIFIWTWNFRSKLWTILSTIFFKVLYKLFSTSSLICRGGHIEAQDTNAYLRTFCAFRCTFVAGRWGELSVTLSSSLSSMISSLADPIALSISSGYEQISTVTKVNYFSLNNVTSVHDHDKRLWEWIKWTPKQNCIDYLSNSVNYSLTSPYRHLYNMDTSLLQTVR